MPEFNKYDAPAGDIAVPTIDGGISCHGCKYELLPECLTLDCCGFNRLDGTHVIFLTEVTPNIEIDIISLSGE